jgi:predicted dehydrogenase
VEAFGANPYVQQADHFATAVFSGKPWIAEEDPVLNMKLIESCLESARKRERISLV